MIARIENGAIVERRDISIDDVPEHKRVAWLPIEGEIPAYDPALQTIDGPSYAIDGNVVRATWTITDKVFTATDYANAIQAHVDTTAKAKGYADGVALAGYSTSTIPAWAAEAQAFIAWRDQIWIYAYTELAKVQAGQREAPTIAGIIGELPSIVWP